ncbi:hypothetical protein IFU23_06550 [Pantoea agglomerans]|uniref:Uncharacterized protein n=1 Tax=Enterobacter agglomerans TaxID=549 RepID=A0ACC5PVD1_ENTAG|nr:hypothetical protein [Pantoea agglomerans]MBD8129063.1 hypothetical protein [Pantoea agglomerans]MBD8153786.1 hypothetical protein [Pantoea agglomerans]MBD8157767.1 hypothetical protein [Pantoea agglomerans]MBD8231605.1 hypothetical protein [Pantoea agglomerans]MBD8241700.1 hypothetical protein [Pantoea agglomerans]
MTEGFKPIRLSFTVDKTALTPASNYSGKEMLTVVAHQTDVPDGFGSYPHSLELLIDEQQLDLLLNQILLWKKERVEKI